MNSSRRQKGLLPNNGCDLGVSEVPERLILTKELIIDWQNKIHSHQTQLFKGLPSKHEQGSLFEESSFRRIDEFQPLNLKPLPLSFWRWPEGPHEGPAIYLVMDKVEKKNSPILLYVGETLTANNRWKGEHDCKNYLASYSEALVNAGLNHQLSIRFWSDVPKDTKARRKIEQVLIKKWLPPFNKETRSRWNTPFTYETS